MYETKLKYFLSAAKHLSFTKAAKDCHVTQSTISKQISVLEEEMGAPLFFRQRSALTLTAAGEALAAKAAYCIEQYEMINRSVLGTQTERELIIGAGPWEWALISKPLELFLSRNPGAAVRCLSFSHKELEAQIRSGAVNVGISSMLSAERGKNLAVRPLGQASWVAVAREDSAFWSLSREARAALEGQTVITLSDDEYEAVKPYCRANATRHAGFCGCDSVPALLALSRAGAGISLAPSFVAELLPGDMQFEDILCPPLTHSFGVVSSPHQRGGAAEQFIKICCKVYGLEPEAEQ